MTFWTELQHELLCFVRADSMKVTVLMISVVNITNVVLSLFSLFF